MRRTVPIESEDLARLQRLQRATRLPRRVILGSALLGWERSHCPPESLSGVEVACGEQQEKLLAVLLKAESAVRVVQPGIHFNKEVV